MNVEEHARGARWIAIQWEPGFDGNSDILSFTILRTEPGSSDYVMVETVDVGDLMRDGDTFRRNITDLLPFTTYTFAVEATNEIGTSDQSRSPNITTNEDRKYLSVQLFLLNNCY